MAENNAESGAEIAAAVTENHPVSQEIATAHAPEAIENDIAEPPTKKAKAEPRKSRTPHKSVDQLLAAEAKAVCGDVDTSSGRQLRKREPPPAKTETKKPAAKASPNKKEPTPKKESTGKGRGRPSTKNKKEEEDNNEEKEVGTATTTENSTDDKHKDAVEGDKNGADEHKEDAQVAPDAAKCEPAAPAAEKPVAVAAPQAPTDASQTTAGGGGDNISPPKVE